MSKAKMIKKATISEEDILYTPKDLQIIFHMGENHVYALMNSNGFPSIRVGRRLYVRKKDIDHWMDCYIGKEYIL